MRQENYEVSQGNIIAAPTFLYGSEILVTRKNQLSRFLAAEIKFISLVKGWTRDDRISNGNVRNDNAATALGDFIENI